MNITLLSYGSRGDVQPFLALAVGLQKAGHAVVLAAPQRFEGFITGFGVRFAPLAGDPAVLSQIFNDAGRNPCRMVRGMMRYLLAIAPEVVKGARQALQDADLVVHGFLFTTGAHSLAREMDIPDVSVQTFPMFAPTRAYPSVALSGAYPGWVNYFSHWFSTQIFWYGGNAGYRQLRRRSPADFPAKLYWPFRPSDARLPTPLLFAFSPTVVPVPEEWRKAHIHVTGSFFLDHPEYRPPEPLECFLAADEAPVCVTFGSMVNREVERVARAVMDALLQNGSRGIFLTGWGGWKPERPPTHTLFLESVPHDWLFARCKMIVHHGGAGTTAAGLRAGIPNVILPHAADQPFWGRRAAACGAGPQPLRLKTLTPDRLVKAFDQAASDEMRSRAAEVGHFIREEDGVGTAVRLIERHAAAYREM